MNYKELYNNGKILNGIDGFKNDYEFLSNFYVHEPITFKLPYGSPDAIEFTANNVEALFQAAKSTNIDTIAMIVEKGNIHPGASKRQGRAIMIRKDWESIKEQVMYELSKIKFEIPELRKKIDEIPNDLYIVEMNYWKDKEWGVCNKTFKGNNKLGKILEKIKGVER